jgi:hypothetical protein
VTTIAYRSGIIAADSRETWETDGGGASVNNCEKLFRKRVGKRDVVIGTAGGSYSGMVFVDWFGSGKDIPTILSDLDLEEDFIVMVLDRGKVYTANHLCRLVEDVNPFIAIGSGRKAALAAMHCGRGAREAVAVACRVDPYTAPPITTMQMPGWKARQPPQSRGKPKR